MTKIAKNIDKSLLSEEQKARSEWMDENSRNIQSVGWAGSRMDVPTPKLDESGIEAIFPASSHPNANQTNAQIVITRDRPRSIFSGYGGKGHPKSSVIDLVAGRVSSFASSFIIDDDGNEEPMVVQPDFNSDAARIYIAEKTDIDFNFGIEQDEKNIINEEDSQDQEEASERKLRFVHDSVGRSAIGMKADAIRLVGNEGVRIVTGVYEFNSRGGKQTPAGIELIAQNTNKRPYDVQPFVKGQNLYQALQELYEEIQSLNAYVEEFIIHQGSINLGLQHHQHFFGAGEKPIVVSLPAIGTLMDEFSSNHEDSQKQLEKIEKKLDMQAQDLVRWEQIYLSPESYDWILSKYNGTN
jgi:hypothetical protein